MIDPPIIPPWSYSALSCFESCPKQYFHRYILKEKDPDTKVTQHGIEVHRALEDRLKQKNRLTQSYSIYEPLVASVEKASEGGMLMVELPLALNSKLEPCQFFGKDVWGRGKADVVILKGPRLWVGDWKTGKVREKAFQISVFAAFLFKIFPQVEQIFGNNLWLQENKPGETYKFQKKDEPGLWQEILYKIGRVELAARKNSFEPKQSGLCRFCAVKSCQYNTSGGE